jgi:hypothetical protein
MGQPLRRAARLSAAVVRSGAGLIRGGPPAHPPRPNPAAGYPTTRAGYPTTRSSFGKRVSCSQPPSLTRTVSSMRTPMEPGR